MPRRCRSAVILPLRPLSPLRHLAPLLLLPVLWEALAPRAAGAQSQFSATDLVQDRFVLVAAPIGSSDRYQLHIYEQVSDRRPCFNVDPGVPASVDPLLRTFNFTGICNRYIDSNGYSLRIGATDFSSRYRISVRNGEGGSRLVASPFGGGDAPELLVARSGGAIRGFHKLQLEPGWKLMRRQAGSKAVGHLYLYLDNWPQGDGLTQLPLPIAPAQTSPNGQEAPIRPAPTVPAASTPAPLSQPTVSPAAGIRQVPLSVTASGTSTAGEAVDATTPPRAGSRSGGGVDLPPGPAAPPRL